MIPTQGGASYGRIGLAPERRTLLADAARSVGLRDPQIRQFDHEYSDADAPDAPPAKTSRTGPRSTGSGLSTSTVERWPTMSADGIFAQLAPVKYLLAGLDICPGAPTLVAGYGFSGKTISLQSAALSIAAGLPVWGTFAVRQGRVLHVDHEQGAHLTRSKYQRLAASMLIAPSDIADRLVLVPMPLVYLDGAVEGFYTDKCTGFDLVIIDSLRAACPTLEENDSGARAVLDMLNRVSNKTGACFVVLHHARKPQPNSAGGARASIRGSGAIFDACGSVLVFDGADRGEPIRVSHEKARTSGRCAEDFLLRIEDQDIDGYPRAGLTVTASAIGQAAPDRDGSKRLDALKERIKGYFREHGDQPSANSVRTRLGVNRDDLYAAMGELKKSGEIVNTGTDKNPNLHLREVEKP